MELKQMLLFPEYEEQEQKKTEAEVEPPYYDPPANDNQKLLNAQYEFIKFGSERAWQKMWTMSRKICRKMVHKEINEKGFFLNLDEIEDAVDNAVFYVLRRFKKVENDYVIYKSFISQLHGGVQHALYYQTGADKIVQFLCDDKLKKLEGKRI